MTAALDWSRDGRGWPNRDASVFVEAGGLRWHVQRAGRGPVLLLLHGTGASTHTWRDVLPRVATRFSVVAPDLPGHAFTEAPSPARQSLPGTAAALAALLEHLGAAPALVAGHSAGAAIACRMALDGAIAPRALVSLNGALLPLEGLPGFLFPPVARLLGASAWLPRLFAWRAGDRAAVERLLRGTGSTIDPAGVELYEWLVRSPAHVAAVLAMMAHWDLRPLARDLPRLRTPLVLVAAGGDRTIPPSQAERVRARVRSARVVAIPGLGHLAHEEAPGQIADLLFDAML